MSKPKKDNSAQIAAQQQAEREAARRAAIMKGTQSIDTALAPFDDQYFAGRQQAYVANAMPTLDQQYADAQKQLVYALSRGGLLNSSEAANRQRQLTEERARYQRDVENAAANFANQGRTDLENTRSNLLSQLTATEDPSAAATAAANKAALLSAPPTFDALGNFVFNTATNLENLSNVSTKGRGLFASSPTASISSAGGPGSSRVTTVGG